MRLAIGSDHIGFGLKQTVLAHLKKQGHEVVDVGADSTQRCDYPRYGYRVAMLVQERKADFGILICGTGVGISLAANKVRGIRAVVCSESYSAGMARQHNNANIVSIGARVVGEDVALQIIDRFLQAEFEGGRHQSRVNMLAQIEEGTFVP